jgi:hypothetical protein
MISSIDNYLYDDAIIFRFLLQGGFARCYEFTNLDNNKVYAGKVVVKSSLTKPKAKQKVALYLSINYGASLCLPALFYNFVCDIYLQISR